MDDENFAIPLPRPTLTPVHGGWSVWSEPSECSRSCGVGIRQQTRKCNNPVLVLTVSTVTFFNSLKTVIRTFFFFLSDKRKLDTSDARRAECVPQCHARSVIMPARCACVLTRMYSFLNHNHTPND